MRDDYHSHDSPAEIIDAAVRMQRENVHLLPPEREEALLGQAGFRDLRLFYAGIWIFGWILWLDRDDLKERCERAHRVRSSESKRCDFLSTPRPLW